MTDKVLTNLIIDGQIMEASCKNDCSMGGFGKRLLATCCSSPGGHILSHSSCFRGSFFFFFGVPRLPVGTVFRFMESSIFAEELHALRFVHGTAHSD